MLKIDDIHKNVWKISILAYAFTSSIFRKYELDRYFICFETVKCLKTFPKQFKFDPILNNLKF